jgi:membrane protein DedA with SNARE-associated domain
VPDDEPKQPGASGSLDPAPRIVAPVPGQTRAWLAIFAGVMGARALGLALLPVLLVKSPALLLVISPMLAHLVLTGPVLGPVVFFAAGLAGSIVQGALAYHFGLALGDKARVWLEGRGAATHAATTRVLEWMERAAPLVLIAMAGPPVCALAGVSRLRAGVFYPVMIFAQILWVGACFLFGTAVTEQLELVHAFVERHVVELSALAIVWVGGTYLWKRHRRRKAAQIE